MKNKSNKKASIDLGKDEEFIKGTKKRNLELFNEIMSLGDGDFESGYLVKINNEMLVMNRLQEIYYTESEEYQLSKFSRYLYLKKVFPRPMDFVNFCNRDLFKVRNALIKKVLFDKIVKVDAVYVEWQGLKDEED